MPHPVDCAEGVQTSAVVSNLNQKWSTILGFAD